MLQTIASKSKFIQFPGQRNGIKTWNVTPTINTGHDATSGEHLTRETKTNRHAEMIVSPHHLQQIWSKLDVSPMPKPQHSALFVDSPIYHRPGTCCSCAFSLWNCCDLNNLAKVPSWEWRIMTCCDGKPRYRVIPVDGRNLGIQLTINTGHVTWAMVTLIIGKPMYSLVN